MAITFDHNPTGYIIDDIAQALTATDLQHVVNQVATSVGFDRVTYHLISATSLPQPTTVFFTNYPDEWVDRYVQEDLYYKDPVVDIARVTSAPFAWPTPSACGLTAENKKFLIEASDSGICNGLSVPIRGCSDYALLSAYLGRARPSEAKKFINYAMPTMALLSMIAHERARTILIPNTGHETVNLSPRQKEILRWVAVGKSSWDIGTILGISEHTINQHIAIAMKKLGCSHRTHAAVRAVALKLIEPPY